MFSTQAESQVKQSYAGRLRDQIFWWLGMKRPFIINDEYKIEMLHMDTRNHRVKIRVTNLKTSEEVIDFAPISEGDLAENESSFNIR